jgi:hypothetical protein
VANITGFKARVEYEVTNGTQTTYTFPFSYLRKKFVLVSILHSDATETALEYGVDYTVNDLSVSLTTPAQVGEHIIIYRQTSTDKIVTWNDGSILLARDMNTEDAQMLHLQEEQQDYITAHAISTKVTSDKEVLWDALNHRVVNVNDPKDPQDAVTKNYMETVQGGFVAANTILVQEATKQANAAKSSQEVAKTSETNAHTSETNSELSHQKAKKWAEATDSPDGEVDTDSTTGKTQSSRSWALYSKAKAQEAATSATNAKTSETNAKASETNAKTSETKAATSEANAKASETNAKTSETKASASASSSASSASASATSATNAKTSETNAANSAKQAAESAGVFQDFKGATASSDGLGGKVPKPLAGEQEKYLKADGTWGVIDIPSGNFVTTDTQQIITGLKTIDNQPLVFTGGNSFVPQQYQAAVYHGTADDGVLGVGPLNLTLQTWYGVSIVDSCVHKAPTIAFDARTGRITTILGEAVLCSSNMQISNIYIGNLSFANYTERTITFEHPFDTVPLIQWLNGSVDTVANSRMKLTVTKIDKTRVTVKFTNDKANRVENGWGYLMATGRRL